MTRIPQEVSSTRGKRLFDISAYRIAKFGGGGKALVDRPFAERWSRKWFACGYEDIGTSMVACGGDFLPDSAAPCLSFDRADRPRPIWEVFGIPSQWPAAEQERLARYRVIGFDGAGNPLCLELVSASVVLLDHEDHFRTKQFVNSSVAQLAECLLAFMGERDASRFLVELQAIDPVAITERSFWWHEAAGLATDAGKGDEPSADSC